MVKPTRPIPLLSEENKRRFYSKIKIDEATGCHMWVAFTNRQGYGTIRIQKLAYLSHRVIFFLDTGIQPKNLLVCHRCDTPGCCNSAHLFLGTPRDNTLDKVQKNRVPKGVKQWSATLTDAIVLEIRRLHGEGLNQPEIARRLGVCVKNLSHVIHRKTWKHI